MVMISYESVDIICGQLDSLDSGQSIIIMTLIC